MRRPVKWCLRALLVLGPLAASSPARAEDIASAEALYNKGFADMNAGRYETGCKALAESQRLDPRLGTLFTLATCEARWGHVATAVTRFRDYLAQYDRLPPGKRGSQAERHRFATAQIEKLTPDVPQLTLSLPAGAPPGAVVKRDGEVVSAATLGVSLPVDPGEHTVSTQVPDGPLWEQRITLSKGEKKAITLEVKHAEVKPPPPPPSAEPAAPPASTGPGWRRVTTYAVGGVGVAGVIAGAVMGGLAVGQKGIVKQHCGAGIGSKDASACDQTGLDASNRLKGLGLGSTLGIVLGTAAVGAAVVLFVTEPRAAAPATGQGSRWISAGALSVGPAGAVLGAQGAW